MPVTIAGHYYYDNHLLRIYSTSVYSVAVNSIITPVSIIYDTFYAAKSFSVKTTSKSPQALGLCIARENLFSF